MKKIIIPFLALLAIAACKNPKVENASETVDELEVCEGETNHTMEGAKALVEAAYNSYFNPTDEEQQAMDDAELSLFCIPYMSKYMTESLLEKLTQAFDKQVETDEMFFDYDVWVNAQDWDKPSLKGVNIIDYSDDKATAEVNFTNFGEDQKAYVVLEYVKASNSWLVSDFLDPEGKTSFVQDLEEYLEE